ncbi:MAG: hydroxymethylglutaryl-CoA lyase [Gammaproteobacteria bacterium]|nr:hydroxymethylglutaryl-CoA lyase [Gammaproteobacteria bacterium]
MTARCVVITDVGPRDGLQNQHKILAVEQRIALVQAIAAAGVPQIEIGSFVSPKKVPAMAATEQVCAGLGSAGFTTPTVVLIPNMRGYELACGANAETVTMVIYASEGMAQKNAAMSMSDAETVTLNILRLATHDNIRVIVTIAVAFTCPFDGPTAPSTVTRQAEKFLLAGADQVVLADTIGAAHPQQVQLLCAELVGRHGPERLGCHFHDTRAMGLANVYAAIESGIRHFDSSIAGLGGCPFAPGASGNVATEDIAMMLQQMGFDTGIDLKKLMQASDFVQTLLSSAPGGRAKAWLRSFLAQ